MPARTLSVDALLAALRLRRVATARALGETLGVSQPTISRLLAAAGQQVSGIGQARSRRYAAVREVRGLGSRWPLFRIDGRGQPQAFGQLLALHGDGCQVTAAQPPPWLRGEFADGLFPGLPWFIDDMRPQGFLGRAFAQRHARELGLRDDILMWNADDVLVALLRHGDDSPGQFVLGEAALEQALRRQPLPLAVRMRARHYGALADATLAGERVGSSAAGEQPKFTACVEQADGSLRQVIVKFSEPVAGNPVGQRWADLLICEHLASEVLREHGQPSARTELITSGGRLCLESTRFDRLGAHGRRGVVSLAAWSDAHDGVRDDWASAAGRMQRDGWLTAAAAAQVQQLGWFGRMIGNTDMHFGNLGFFLDDALPLQLAPSYDMLPMLYRPAANGGIAPRDYQPPPPSPAALAHWQQAAGWAMQLWQQASRHAQISVGFRQLAADNDARLAQLRERFG